eukprot:Sdes_comp20208_c0_seq1m13538
MKKDLTDHLEMKPYCGSEEQRNKVTLAPYNDIQIPDTPSQNPSTRSESRSSCLVHSCNHLKWLVISGFGLFSDLYDLAVIDLVKNIMQLEYSRSNTDISFVTSMALAGTLVGTIFFGCLADYFGRKIICIITAFLMIVGAIGSAFSYPVGDLNIYYILGLWRFVLGVGIGGEYPLSALLAKETVGSSQSGSSLNRACSMMVLGTITAPLVILSCLLCGASNDFTWRFALGFGAFPTGIAFWLRWRMCETAQFTKSRQNQKGKEALLCVKHNHLKASCLLVKVYWRPLSTVAVSWFLYETVSYGLGLFNGTITADMGLGSSIQSQTFNVLYVNLLALPGTLIGLLFMDSWGRKVMQLIGFGGISVIFLVIAISYQYLSDSRPIILLLLYGISKSFEQLALFPIFASSAEMFPTMIRGICHGSASAAGKLGAVVGSSGFPSLQALVNLPGTFYVCCILMSIACLWTIFTFPYYNSQMLTRMMDLDDYRIMGVLYPFLRLPADPFNVCCEGHFAREITDVTTASCNSQDLKIVSSASDRRSSLHRPTSAIGVFKSKMTEGHLLRLNSFNKGSFSKASPENHRRVSTLGSEFGTSTSPSSFRISSYETVHTPSLPPPHEVSAPVSEQEAHSATHEEPGIFYFEQHFSSIDDIPASRNLGS